MNKENKLYVNYTDKNISSYRSDEDYGEWSDVNDFNIESVTIEKINEYCCEQFTVDFDVNVGDTVYVLSMIYSYGDSFGRSEGNGEVIWLFKTKQKAQKALNIIQDNEDEYTIEFKSEKGTKVKFNNPAYDYFSTLSSLEIKQLIVR